MQNLLLKAYRLFPRVVLAACLHAHRGSDSVLASASLILLEKHLLCERKAFGSECGSGSSVGSGSGSQSSCLASKVLEDLPETQAWLRQAIVLATKGGSPFVIRVRLVLALQSHCIEP